MAYAIGPDPVTNAATTGTEGTRAVHDGRSFAVTHSLSVAIDDDAGMILSTNNHKAQIYGLAITYDLGPITLTFFENATYRTNLGPPDVVSNNNRADPRTRGFVVFTVDDIGGDPELAKLTLQGSATAGDERTWRPVNPVWVLKPNTDYGLRIFNPAGNPAAVNCTVTAAYYEFEEEG